MVYGLRTHILPLVEFTYNNSVNRSTSRSPFEIMYGSKVRQPTNLIPLPTNLIPLPTTSHSSELVESFTERIREIHADVRRKIVLSNKTYKVQVDAHCKFKEYNVGDCVCLYSPRTFSQKLLQETSCSLLGPFQILTKIGTNSYVVDLPANFNISPIFNIEELPSY